MYKIRKVITYTTFLKEVIDGFIGPIGCMMSFAGGSSLSQPMVWGWWLSVFALCCASVVIFFVHLDFFLYLCKV